MSQPLQRQFTTIGYVFVPGDIPVGKTLVAKTASGKTVPVQVNAKATHADGSLRHAVLTLETLPDMTDAEKITFSPGPAVAIDSGAKLSNLLKVNFDAHADLTLSDGVYSVSIKKALQEPIDSRKIKSWLTGPLVNEWVFNVPFRKASGEAHPHLSASVAVRVYTGLKSIRLDLSVENDWAFEPNPKGFTYDANIVIDGKNVYTKAGLKHTHHTRWRKIFWWGEESKTAAEEDQDYWFSTGAFPNYERTLKIAESALAALPLDFEPMSNGDWTSYMPETCAHNDIGPLPRNTAMYLISQDARAKTNVLANGTTAGSYQVHYRDKDKLKPLFIDDYPYVTIQGNVGDTYNPLTKKSEAFPTVTGGLDVYTPDHAHQPSMAYIPYMISGDYFYLEELQFWATWNMVLANPGYRLGKMGLLKWGQERAQAWSMRTLGDAAYITPDSDPLKGYFVEKIKNNIDWYAQTFSNPATKEINSLGWLPGGLNSAAYPPFGIATWQDDFFTYSMGHLLSLGFTSARALIDWKGKFVVGRLSDPGYCWLYAAPYTLQLKPADGLTVYGSFTALFKANFPDSTCNGLVMKGYPEIGTGYPANMQPALAMAVDAGLPSAAAAWAKYQTRNPKQDYTKDPQFDIIPGGPLLNNAIKKVSSKRLGNNSTPLELHQNPTTQVLRLKKNGVENIYDAKGGSRIEK